MKNNFSSFGGTFFISCLLVLLAISHTASAFEPLVRQTIPLVSQQSDLFAQGVVTNITYSKDNRGVISTCSFRITQIHANNLAKSAIGSVVPVLVRGGVDTDPTGKRYKVKDLVDPELILNKSYLLYLRWSAPLNAYTVVSGEAGAFEVNAAGHVLTIQGNAITAITQGIIRTVPDHQPVQAAPPVAVSYDIHGQTTPVAPVAKASMAIPPLLTVQQFVTQAAGTVK